MKHTRADYIENRCTHSEYYAQFVTDYALRRVAAQIGIERIRKSKDPHLNDIPLGKWDGIFAAGCPAPIADLIRAAGDHPTMAGMVCIAKAAARQLASGIPA